MILVSYIDGHTHTHTDTQTHTGVPAVVCDGPGVCGGVWGWGHVITMPVLQVITHTHTQSHTHK